MENQVKLTQEELEKVVTIKKEIDARQFELGRIEILKSEIISGAKSQVVKFENKQLNEVKKELSDKYGDCEINLSTGEITKKEQEETNG